MKKGKIMIACVLLLALHCSCSRDYVPAVPEEFWSYFPYEVGDKLVYTDGTEDMVFEVSEKYINKKDGWVYGDHAPYTEMWFCAKNISHSLEMEAKISVSIHLTQAKYSASMTERSASTDCHYEFELMKDYDYGSNPSSEIVFTSPMGGVIKSCPVDIECMVLKREEGIVLFFDARNNSAWKLKEIVN